MAGIRDVIEAKGRDVLNVYFTAGHPTLDSVVPIIIALEKYGANLIELGMPYSDPLADGPTIQKSSEAALKNGQTIENIFKQVRQARANTAIPIILMGYYNQMLQYGVESFLKDAHNSGINGLIIPDLPMDVYAKDYKSLFEHYKMEISFLITPLTSTDRIYQADELSSAFIYIVSQSSITGKQGGISEDQLDYFSRINAMQLRTPSLIGFGIHNRETRSIANKYSNGAIVGSAFIRALEHGREIDATVKVFMEQL